MLNFVSLFLKSGKQNIIGCKCKQVGIYNNEIFITIKHSLKSILSKENQCLLLQKSSLVQNFDMIEKEIFNYLKKQNIKYEKSLGSLKYIL